MLCWSEVLLGEARYGKMNLSYTVMEGRGQVSFGLVSSGLLWQSWCGTFR